jgi:hypothetical protein
MQDSPEIAFTPVPLARSRRDGWSAERQQRFIELLAQIGLVAVCARAVGMSAKSAYALRKRPGAEDFANAWDEAVGLGRFAAEVQAIDRAMHGERRPIFYQGRQVGERTVYNDKLLIAVLRAKHPKYAGGGFEGW